jgi:hypothetical protein
MRQQGISTLQNPLMWQPQVLQKPLMRRLQVLQNRLRRPQVISTRQNHLLRLCLPP